MLSLCACAFFDVFSLHDDYYILFAFVSPRGMIILYWAFSLHTLHFTTAFCTLLHMLLHH